MKAYDIEWRFREMAKKSKKKEPMFVVTFPLMMNGLIAYQFVKIFDISRTLYNACLGEIKRRYTVMKESRRYQKIQRQLRAIHIKREKEKSEKNIKKLEKEMSNLYKERNLVMQVFGYNEYSLHTFVAPMKRHYDTIDINTAQKLATRAWNSMEKVRKGEANKVCFIKYGEMTSIEGKDNKMGIRFRDGKRKKNEHEFLMKMNDVSVPVVIPKNDMYGREVILNRKKVKYCRILRKIVRGNVRFFIQLVILGIPPTKRCKVTGRFSRKLGSGKVGVDEGTQTIAVSSQDLCLLRELAPDVDKMENEKRLLLKKMDRSRRAMNPHKYHPDGTVKKGNKEKWVYSQNYTNVRFQYNGICRKQQAKRRQSHNRLSNVILSLGSEFYIEQMNMKALQKRAKETKINGKTGKFVSKKRFGKSIANKAPALFVQILENKLLFLGGKLHKVNTWKVKASQFSHETCECTKKSLSARWHELQDGTMIQRDLYSAFLLQHVKNNLEEIDQELCNNDFLIFKKKHDFEIERLRFHTEKMPSSIGI